MIKIKYVPKKVKKHSCDNCNREMPFVLQYSFHNDKEAEYNKLTLCEDCANAVANLFYSSMEKGESFKYEHDEISCIERKPATMNSEFEKAIKDMEECNIKQNKMKELKTIPKFFNAVREGMKTFEVRKDDRNFQVGDLLELKKYENGYTTDRCIVKITYILGRKADEKMYVPDGYVILGIK